VTLAPDGLARLVSAALPDEELTAADLETWARTIHERTAGLKEVYVYFKHEDAGKGPEFSRVLLDALAKL